MEYRENVAMLPEHMRGPMLDYIDKGWLPGGFLTAVLCNDLKGAFSRADMINKPRIGSFVEYLMWYAPAICWGSPEKVSDWYDRGGLQVREEEE